VVDETELHREVREEHPDGDEGGDARHSGQYVPEDGNGIRLQHDEGRRSHGRPSETHGQRRVGRGGDPLTRTAVFVAVAPGVVSLVTSC
jgi:hypothetical protein